MELTEANMELPKRILHVLGALDRGGAEVMIMNIYRHIDRQAIQFDFIVHTEEKGAFDDEIRSMGGRIFTVPRFRWEGVLKYKKAWNAFLDEHKHEFIAVHGHMGSLVAIYLRFAKNKGLFTIAHSHGTGNSPNLTGFLYTIFAYPTRFVADFFFACSNAAGISRFGKHIVASKRFSLVKNAIETDQYVYSPIIRSEVRNSLGFKNEFVIGHVGRFDILKNHKFILEVFKLITMKEPTSKLLLVGDGERRSYIEKLIEDYQLQDHVVMTGMRSDVPQLLQAMDVFIFPSLAEGLGISLIEAQASGLPCVASSAVPEEAKITGLVSFLSLEKDQKLWVEKILSIRNSKARNTYIQEIKNAGYDVRETAKELEAFYHDIVRGGSR